MNSFVIFGENYKFWCSSLCHVSLERSILFRNQILFIFLAAYFFYRQLCAAYMFLFTLRPSSFCCDSEMIWKIRGFLGSEGDDSLGVFFRRVDFLRRNILSPSWVLKMATECFSESLASTDESTLCQNPDERHHHHRHQLMRKSKWRT
jgi:hypothetical protein